MIPKVIEVRFKERITPNMSSGTGYDEPSTYEVILDNGEVQEETLYDWYRPYEKTAKDIKDICYGMPIMNPGEAFMMFLECWKKQVGIK